MIKLSDFFVKGRIESDHMPLMVLTKEEERKYARKEQGNREEEETTEKRWKRIWTEEAKERYK